MHRRGETLSSIAAALQAPLSEIELLLKLDRVYWNHKLIKKGPSDQGAGQRPAPQIGADSASFGQKQARILHVPDFHDQRGALDPEALSSHRLVTAGLPQRLIQQGKFELCHSRIEGHRTRGGQLHLW